MAASVVLVPTMLNMMGVARVTGHLGEEVAGLKGKVVYELFKLYYLLFPSVGEAPESFMGFMFNSTQPYIAVFGIMLAVVYAVRRRDWLGWLFATLVVLYLTRLNGIFCLFTNPFYTRWVYGLVLVGTLASLVLIKDGVNIPNRVLAIYMACAALVMAAAVAYKTYISIHIGQPIFNLRMSVEMALAAVNLICLIFWIYRKCDTRVLLWCIVICSASNLTATLQLYFNYPDVSATEDSCMRDFMARSTDALAHEDMSYEFRTDFVTSSNMSMMLNRPSISTFHSMFNKNVVPLRAVVDTLVTPPRFRVEYHHMDFAALMSVKQVLAYKDVPNNVVEKYYPEGLDMIDSSADVRVYDYTYHIPPGFSYDSYITESELLNSGDTVNSVRAMLGNLVIADADVTELKLYLRHGTPDFVAPLDSLVQMRRRVTCTDFKGDSSGFTACVDNPHAGVIFFSVPADEGFTATVDGEATHIYKVNLGLSAIVVPAGSHEIVFRYFPPGLKVGALMTLIAFILIFGYSFLFEGRDG